MNSELAGVAGRDPATPHTHLFVGGLHRSGTTPLARAIASHPEVSPLSGTGVSEDEGQHLQDLYPRIRRYGGMGRFATDPRAHLTETSTLLDAGARTRLLDTWSAYWDMSKPYLLEKSPSNIVMSTFLQELFPGAYFVVIVRHPIATCLALMKWNPRLISRNGRRHVTLTQMTENWIRAHAILRSDVRRVEHLHLIRYEHLVERPEEELQDMARFLGLPSSVPCQQIKSGRSDIYQQEWDDYAEGPWWLRRARRDIERRYGSAMDFYGYDVDNVTRCHSARVDDARIFPGSQ